MATPKKSTVEFLGADIFGLTKLASHGLSHRPAPPGFGSLGLPAKLDEIPVYEERFLPDERAELCGKLEAKLTTLEPHVAVLESVRSLGEPGASAVVCGQQPGFLGGPLFNIYKALHTVRLARSLTELWGKPVVPIIWNHADDHDIAEVHNARLITPHLDLRRLHLPGTSSGRAPFSKITIDKDEQRLISLTEVLRDTLAADMFSNDALELFVPRHGETIASAWTRAMTGLLGHLGLVVLEPDWIRADLSRALASVIAQDPLPALLENKARLKSAGFQVAIDPEEAALVYRVSDGERHALRPGGDGFRFDNEAGSRTPSELAAEIVTTPEEFTAGALLRPLVQDLALPVAAYVGGFGELAYHVQLTELRQSRDVPEPPFVPRFSCTLLDGATEDSLDQAGCSVGDYLRTKGAAAGAEGGDSDHMPDDLAAEIHAMSKAFRKELNALRPRLAEVSSHLPQMLKHASRQVHGQLQRFGDKVDRVCNNNVGGVRREQRRLRVHLLPDGQPQERVLTAAQFCARFGTDWIDDLFEVVEALPTEHLVFRLGHAPKRRRNQASAPPSTEGDQ